MKSIFAAFTLMSAVVLAGHSGANAMPRGGKVSVYRVNSVRNAITLGEKFKECLKDKACNGALKAAVTYFGGDASAVDLAAKSPEQRKEREESKYNFLPPIGYSLCKAQIRTISVVPADGPRGSFAGFRVWKAGISVYTWTPRLPLGRGRSWYDGTLTLLSVPANSYDNYYRRGVCTVPPNYETSINRSCRGKGCGTYNF
jgi:hypothetical protein